jgi:ABC-2 type transport system permease protein
MYSAQVLNREQGTRLVAATMDSGAPVHPAIPQIITRARVWFNPDLRSRNYFIPGVIVNSITITTLSLTAMAIVREKEIGTMEQLMVTPIRPAELILGKTLPFVVIGLWDMLLSMSAALLLFHIPFAGSFGLLLVSTLLFLLTTLGAGLFISTVCTTQQQAAMATGLFFQPFFMLSGFTFPIRNMPVLAQWITFLNPVRYIMEIVRGVFLQGAGVEALWPQMVALAVFGVIILGLSVLRFQKRVE